MHVVEGCGCSCGGGAVETMFPVWAYFAMLFRVTLSLRAISERGPPRASFSPAILTCVKEHGRPRCLTYAALSGC